jgi:hypothetical protein
MSSSVAPAEVGASRRRTARHELALAAALAVAAAAEELDAVGDDLDRLALRAVLRVPLAPVEAPVDADGRPLREVLRAALALVAPDGDVEVVRLVAPLAGARPSGACSRRGAACRRRAARRVPQLGSLVRLPTRTTRLMLAITPLLHCSRSGSRRTRPSSVLRLAVGARAAAGGLRRASAADGEVPHDAVGDLEHARDLVQRSGSAREGQRW